MNILGIIPARYGSTRFPAKPLTLIDGKPMVQRVYEQASQAKRLQDVVVATDHQEIFDCVKGFGGVAHMTSKKHESGTDRCAEVALAWKTKIDYVINIQGDEPFIAPDQIDLLASLFNGQIELATLIKKIDNIDHLTSPNVVKVIKDKNSNAIYFSRSPLPFQRIADKDQWLGKHLYYKHIGMYGYRVDILKDITKLPVSELEKAESLEQLRWIENGYVIKTAETSIESLSIDTPEDLQRMLLSRS